VTLADPARHRRARHACAAGRDVCIDVGCVFEGKVKLGDRRAASAPIACIRDSAHRRRQPQVEAYQPRSSGAQRGRRRASSAPMPGCGRAPSWRTRSHVGNFVESQEQPGRARAARSTTSRYVGDATVGARVNIGAGTITCNYDGANKHRTAIGDDAFIGSDTQLVAPVARGRGCHHRRRHRPSPAMRRTAR
jgi:bifunctional UDP-N-acetylglucosamine pyrophosphorylase/glucosamine-1-phosphate N-acetyltransferase